MIKSEFSNQYRSGEKKRKQWNRFWYRSSSSKSDLECIENKNKNHFHALRMASLSPTPFDFHQTVICVRLTSILRERKYTRTIHRRTHTHSNVRSYITSKVTDETKIKKIYPSRMLWKKIYKQRVGKQHSLTWFSKLRGKPQSCRKIILFSGGSEVK